jgi:hypothetical protein
VTDHPKPLSDAISALSNEESAILKEMRRLDLRLSQIRTARAALVALESDEPVTFHGGLADACRTVLKNSPDRSLVPTDVRDRVIALGYDHGEHANFLASVHSTMKRLVESGEVRTKTWKKDPGTTRYVWVGQAGFTPAPKPPNPIKTVSVIRPVRDVTKISEDK